MAKIPLLRNATWPVPYLDTSTGRLYHSDACEPGVSCVCSMDAAEVDSILLSIEEREHFA